MNGHDILGGFLTVKAAIDTLRSLVALLRAKPPTTDLVPVYRPVQRPDA